MNNVTEQILNEINKTDTKDETLKIEIQDKLSPQDLMAIESIKKIKNPFRMIGVETVMKDLKICRTIAYKLFQRDDFPSIDIGKNKQIMVLAYLIWKMNKRV